MYYLNYIYIYSSVYTNNIYTYLLFHLFPSFFFLVLRCLHIYIIVIWLQLSIFPSEKYMIINSNSRFCLLADNLLQLVPNSRESFPLQFCDHACLCLSLCWGFLFNICSCCSSSKVCSLVRKEENQNLVTIGFGAWSYYIPFLSWDLDCCINCLSKYFAAMKTLAGLSQPCPNIPYPSLSWGRIKYSSTGSSSFSTQWMQFTGHDSTDTCTKG